MAALSVSPPSKRYQGQRSPGLAHGAADTGHAEKRSIPRPVAGRSPMVAHRLTGNSISCTDIRQHLDTIMVVALDLIQGLKLKQTSQCINGNWARQASLGYGSFSFQVYVIPLVLFLQFRQKPCCPDRESQACCGAHPLSFLLQFQQIQVCKPSQFLRY